MSVEEMIGMLTLEEKLHLICEWRACHTRAFPEKGIPELWLFDGATGVNGAQLVIDKVTDPEAIAKTGDASGFAGGEMVNLVKSDLRAERKKANSLMKEEVLDQIERFRTNGKQFLTFPSGVSIGASFSEKTAEKIGRAVGTEMRDSGIDFCLGPNVDIARDPLGGRCYEMYGEDPVHAGMMGASFIKGVQSVGVAACAKHFIANNQETNRNGKNEHVSERTLREIYGRGFEWAVKKGKVKSLMTAYNAVNGVYSSYNKELLTGWLREEWGFEGVVVTDWGAADTNQDQAFEAGADMILCGPNHIEECLEAVKKGALRMETVDRCVRNILNAALELKERQKNIAVDYDQQKLIEIIKETVIDGTVLLKNEDALLPLTKNTRVTIFGSRSKNTFQCGEGSTNVVSAIQSHVYDAFSQEPNCRLMDFEEMEGDVLIYVAAAPSGENADRRDLDVEPEDKVKMPEVLKTAKNKGIKTVVVLNVCGPVQMSEWIEFADAVLCIFIPGCAGGEAVKEMIYGDAVPGGRLPVTFPMSLEDTPCYPNFPGEYTDVYYGEGIFVGYRHYEKRHQRVLFPFGYGLSYTMFETRLLKDQYEFDWKKSDSIKVSCQVTNTGDRAGSQVVFIFAAENNPRVLRPVKELAGFQKVYLQPGESKKVEVEIFRDSLKYYDDKMRQWVFPVGDATLYVGNSVEDIVAAAELKLVGDNAYKISLESTFEDFMENEDAYKLLSRYAERFGMKFTKAGMRMIRYFKVKDILAPTLIQMIPDTVKVSQIMDEINEKLAKLAEE